MRLVSCANPKYIVNPYTNREMMVPCGKCSVCRNRRSLNWTTRLEMESACWPYVIFFTLTYSDEFVPKILYKDSEFVYKNTGLVIDLVSMKLDLSSENEYLFIEGIKKIGSVNVLDFHDVQNFIKRLRYYFKITQLEANENLSNFRYFISGEYGPQSFRPHYHGILWFSSKSCVEKIEQLLCKAWSVKRNNKYFSIGRIDVQSVQSTAASYVASYVNGFADLPKFLACAEHRPRAIFSRRPPIGVLLARSVQLCQLFHNSSPTLYLPFDGQLVAFPLWPSFEGRLFPKFRGSCEMSVNERITVVSILSKFEDWSECLEFCVGESQKSYRTFFIDYVDKLTDGFLNVKPLKQVWRVCCRIKVQSQVFGVRLQYYIMRIDEYYKNKDYIMLRNQLEFEEKYTDRYNGFGKDVRFLLGLDPLLRISVDKYKSLGKNADVVVQSYGFSDYSDFLLSPEYSFELSDDYKEVVCTAQKIVKDKTKSKKNNEYLGKFNEGYFLQSLFHS